MATKQQFFTVLLRVEHPGSATSDDMWDTESVAALIREANLRDRYAKIVLEEVHEDNVVATTYEMEKRDAD